MHGLAEDAGQSYQHLLYLEASIFPLHDLLPKLLIQVGVLPDCRCCSPAPFMNALRDQGDLGLSA